MQGSPLIDVLQRPPQSWLFSLVAWFQDWEKEALASMSAKISRRRFSEIPVFSDVLVINYLGVPLSGQLSRYSRDKYPILKSEGPNDGLTLLTDVVAPNSQTIVALGQDHFFAEDPQINLKTVALMNLIISILENDRAMPFATYESDCEN